MTAGRLIPRNKYFFDRYKSGRDTLKVIERQIKLEYESRKELCLREAIFCKIPNVESTYLFISLEITPSSFL